MNENELKLEALPWTGERYLTEIRGDIELEHLHRYLLAKNLTIGKRVLDIASGEGYGCALLAQSSISVFGVDISAEAVAHASEKYQADNLKFKVGSCAKIPLDNHSVDVVISFETIEHIYEHNEMMREIKRVLVPGGLLVMSCPDKFQYSDRLRNQNPYHVKELYRNEFESLLDANFQNYLMAGQRVLHGSVIFSENRLCKMVSYDINDQTLSETSGISNPVYWIAVASDSELPSIESGILEGPVHQSDIVLQLNSTIDKLHQMVNEYDLKLNECMAQAEHVININRELNNQIQQIYASRSWRLTRICRLLGRFKRKDFLQSAILKNKRIFSKIGRVINQSALLDKAGETEIFKNLNNKDFDPDFYLKIYPDIRDSNLCPKEHFLKHGHAEGRIGTLPKLHFSKSLDQLNKNKETLIVVSHEASLTGAPILALNIVYELISRYNILLMLYGGGKIEEQYHNAGAVVLNIAFARGSQILSEIIIQEILSKCEIKFAIVNSIESRWVLSGLAKNNIPSLLLIHEFASYTRPKNEFLEAALLASKLVFSSNITLQNALVHIPNLEKEKFHILPQGRCRIPQLAKELNLLDEEKNQLYQRLSSFKGKEDVFLVMGAGSVNLRKGVDIFIQCAARAMKLNADKNIRFVWIGNGYAPESDLVYSVYLADQIQRLNLQDHILFLEETTAIDIVYQEADLFLLSSRLDPLPNVAIDAMSQGLPVICFEKATGIADYLIQANLAGECVASYLDTEDMSNKIVTLIKDVELLKVVGDRSRKLALEQFNMNFYINGLEKLSEKALDQVLQEDHELKEVASSTQFNMQFSCPKNLKGITREDYSRIYVKAWATGVMCRKPFPGFHPGIFKETCQNYSYGDPFVDYLQKGCPEGPWMQKVIYPATECVTSSVISNTKVALHLHVYYPKVLDNILNRLNLNKVIPDLFISVPTTDIFHMVSKKLENYLGNVVRISVVPNRGRDIGPFLTEFGREIASGYEIVGHLHTKVSAGIKDSITGFVWYEFLLENLLGGQGGSMADTILTHMINDPSIGLVFPDDPNIVSWGNNKIYAYELARLMGLGELPENINFPVGTMFWARISALQPLFDIDLNWNDYPIEPLPNDGSILHAIERMLPYLMKSGISSVVTNVPGITR